MPTAMQGCVIDLSNVLIQSYINSFGSVAVAGIGAYSRVEGFGFLPVTAFSMAISTYISQNIGARKPDRVKSGMIFGLIVGVVCAQVIGCHARHWKTHGAHDGHAGMLVCDPCTGIYDHWPDLASY